MENENNEKQSGISADAPTLSPEKVETSAPETAEEFDIMQILGEPTERKPEHWEQAEKVDEHLADFDPPPPVVSDPDSPPDETKIIDPDKSLRKVPKSVVSAGAKMMSPVIVEMIDTIVPTICSKIAKVEDSERFCANPEAKKSMSESLDAWMGEANIELSPMWVFLAAFGTAYTPAAIDVYELRKAHTTIAKQQSMLNVISEKQRETENLLIEEERKKLKALDELAGLKLKIAQQEESAAKKQVGAKRIAKAELKKPNGRTKKRNNVAD